MGGALDRSFLENLIMEFNIGPAGSTHFNGPLQ